jgi:hypothetical protein
MLLITLAGFMGSRLIEGRHRAESIGVLGKAPPRWMPAPSRHAQPSVGVHEPTSSRHPRRFRDSGATGICASNGRRWSRRKVDQNAMRAQQSQAISSCGSLGATPPLAASSVDVAALLRQRA